MSERPAGKPIFPGGKPILDEPPPFLRTWPRVYRFVLIYLAAVIFLFWLFTRHYAPPQT
jgi:hypothetical protein